jgi:hypothetical protein
MPLHRLPAILAAAAILCPAARAHEWPDGPNKHYLEKLQRPDNAKSPRFRIEPAGGRHPEDRWYAWLKEEWVLVPPEKIVADFAPDGQPYLFLLAGTIQCFVRPKGGL